MGKTQNKYDNSYIYPDHFYAPVDEDAFTLHIYAWERMLEVFKGRDNLNFLELGTQYGRASVYLLENILTGKNCHLDTVDIIETRTSNTGELISVNKNLAPYIESNLCTFHHMDTNEFFGKYSLDKKYDLIYIDASHEREDVLMDAIHSYCVLGDMGVIIFDDYGWGECGQAIDAFLNIFSRKIHLISKQWQVVVQKREVPLIRTD